MILLSIRNDKSERCPHLEDSVRIIINWLTTTESLFLINACSAKVSEVVLFGLFETITCFRGCSFNYYSHHLIELEGALS